VRHLAFTSLQRSLLSPELTSSDHEEWTAIFGEVLFPLILRLLKPEVFSTDRDGMSETRVQAASLLCKVFLQYLVLLSEWEGMLDLWLKIIDMLDRLMNSGQGDSLVSTAFHFSHLPLPMTPNSTLGNFSSKRPSVTNKQSTQEEAVPENLKNVLLFMASSGYLVPPRPGRTEAQEKLWTETWKRIDRFLPELRKELAFDEEPEKTATPRTSVAKEVDTPSRAEEKRSEQIAQVTPKAEAGREEEDEQDEDDDDAYEDEDEKEEGGRDDGGVD
jgi:golgi-specific brefeldin A-resistance guanine nucleotide exchange factor 1